MASRNSSSTRPAAAAKSRSIPVTFCITTTKKSSSAITKEKFSNIPRPETKTCSSRRNANITTSICTHSARVLSFRAESRNLLLSDGRAVHDMIKSLVIPFASLTLLLSSAGAETSPAVEVRFCPSAGVHTYPLESRRELQSLMLQNLAVINHGAAPFKIDNIELELLQSGQVLDAKKLD